jgi:hypothetical protein
MKPVVRNFLILAPAVLIISILLNQAPSLSSVTDVDVPAAEIFLDNGMGEDFYYLRNLGYLYYLVLLAVFSFNYYMSVKSMEIRSYLRYLMPIGWGVLLITFSFAIAAFIYDLGIVLSKYNVI